MSDFLHIYWRGVLQRLQAEVENMNHLSTHQGVKGTENEATLLRVLEGLVPTRYGVGSGLVIDSTGGSSRQMDLIIYDQGDQPALLAQTNQFLFPVESVRLCIEVKTSISSTEVRDARKKYQSLQNLTTTSSTPALALFGYSSTTSAKAVAGNMSAATTSDGPRPNFACVVDMGFIASSLDDEWTAGVAHMPNINQGGAAGGAKYEMPTSSEAGATFVIREGARFPVVEIDKEAVVADPSRALLLFMEQSLLAIMQRDTVMSHYMGSAIRNISLL